MSKLNCQSQSQNQSYITTDSQSASLSWCQAPIRGIRPDFYYYQRVAGVLMWSALSDERTGLPFIISAGPRQRNHSWVWFPRSSWPYFTVSDSRLPQPGGPSPRIYIPQKEGGPVISPGTGFPFHRRLRLAVLRRTYSTPPPRGVLSEAEAQAKAYCRQPAGTLTPGIGPRWDPWPYICSMSRPLFFSFSWFSLLMKEGQSQSQSYVTTNCSVGQAVLE
jgi:hypothetical protein